MSTPLRTRYSTQARQRISDFSSALFFERGLQGTRMDAIAERMSCAKPFVLLPLRNKASPRAVCVRPRRSCVGWVAAGEQDWTISERLFDLVRELSRRS